MEYIYMHLQVEQLGQQNKWCMSEERALQPGYVGIHFTLKHQGDGQPEKVAVSCCLGHDDCMWHCIGSDIVLHV